MLEMWRCINAIFLQEPEQKIPAGSGKKQILPGLSVYHLFFHVMTLQNIWRALYVLMHPVEITSRQGRQLWHEGLWDAVVNALPVWLLRPSGNIRDEGGEQKQPSLCKASAADVPITMTVRWYNGSSVIKTCPFKLNEAFAKCGNRDNREWAFKHRALRWE